MSPLALGLVILAAFSHATWNLLTKRSRHQLTFLWWTALVGTGLFLPAVAWTTPSWRWPAATWAGIALAAAVRAAYLAALGAAYAGGTSPWSIPRRAASPRCSSRPSSRSASVPRGPGSSAPSWWGSGSTYSTCRASGAASGLRPSAPSGRFPRDGPSSPGA